MKLKDLLKVKIEECENLQFTLKMKNEEIMDWKLKINEWEKKVIQNKALESQIHIYSKIISEYEINDNQMKQQIILLNQKLKEQV